MATSFLQPLSIILQNLSYTTLVPDLLQVDECKFPFDEKTALKVIVEYDFLPKSVIPRFIVNMHDDICDDLRWRTGVVLKNADVKATAVVKSDEEAKSISVFVNGEQKREYASVVRHQLSRINKSFDDKVGYKELVPCNCEVCEKCDDPRLHEYETLTKFRKEGIKEFHCQTSAKKVSVDMLLDGLESPQEEIVQLLTEIKDSMQQEKILRLLEDIKDNKDESKLEAVAKIIKAKPIDLKVVELDYVELINQLRRRWSSKQKKANP